uniref:Galactose-3-O-sulfotransferase 2-like n=1 Tax=Saccoglossus kowalevskii TaxID=10224 RepID=A0ABM0GX92_SACKO|nr:PREDICTED: galactose-3-O-sulfotransferase 2-like [Saccoglossus kowalevskii]
MVNNIKYPPLNGGKHYDLLTNHVGYNRNEMEAVIPNATYVTVLRHPVNQLVSAFSYFRWGKAIKVPRPNKEDVIDTFMEEPSKYLKGNVRLKWQSHNGQLYDLGFKTENNVITDDLVYKHIEILGKEMDLVLITEYFDESLLIMKKQLCWSMDDIVYISKCLGTSRHTMTQQTRDKILKWNRGDLLLYQHFNRTLWEKIAEYGPTFEEDLQQFRGKLQETLTECVDPSKMNTKDRRERKYVLKTNASKECVEMSFEDTHYTNIIRTRQLN